jgi:hypothetical protein
MLTRFWERIYICSRKHKFHAFNTPPVHDDSFFLVCVFCFFNARQPAEPYYLSKCESAKE